MREDGINKIEAKTSKIVLDKSNIKKEFIRLDNARDIRYGQVKRLIRVLESGSHFETPFVTHLKDKKYRLLDGNHRHEAVTTYLERHPNRKVEAWIFYYEGLSEQDEREYYTKWNSGLKQSTNDFVKQYWSKIPIVKLIEANSFPFAVTPGWTSKSMEFKLLVSPYLTRTANEFYGGFTGSAIEFIEEAKKLNMDDYKRLKEFLREYIEIFGNPDKQNMHYRLSVFASMMRIWLDNLTKVTYSQFKTGFLKVRNSERVVWYSSLGGSRENCTLCRRDILQIMNRGHRTPLFV